MSKDKLTLSKEVTDKAIKEIQHYFLMERDEDLGILSATLILEFFTDKLGPAFYNQGLQDAMRFITEKAEDIYSLEK